MPKPNLLWCKNIANIATFNVKTLHTINELHELVEYAIKPHIDLIFMQEH